MGNLPDTYYVLVTLPDTTGEEADHYVSELQLHARLYAGRAANAEHLTKETLPDRYIVRAPQTFWTLTHIADWEGGTTIYRTRDELVAQVMSDVREAAESAGETLDTMIDTVDVIDGKLTDVTIRLADADLDTLADYVHENGWKVHHYTIEQHSIDTLVSA